MRRIDWRGLLRLGLRDLGLRPAEFWALTPVELRVMAGAEGVAPPLTRARLAELAAAFPDVKRGMTDGRDHGDAGPACGA